MLKYKAVLDCATLYDFHDLFLWSVRPSQRMSPILLIFFHRESQGHTVCDCTMVILPLMIFVCCLQGSRQLSWTLPEGFHIQFEGEQAELFVGGIYVRLFLKNSQFPLRHPKVGQPVAVPFQDSIDMILGMHRATLSCNPELFAWWRL